MDLRLQDVQIHLIWTKYPFSFQCLFFSFFFLLRKRLTFHLHIYRIKGSRMLWIKGCRRNMLRLLCGGLSRKKRKGMMKQREKHCGRPNHLLMRIEGWGKMLRYAGVVGEGSMEFWKSSTHGYLFLRQVSSGQDAPSYNDVIELWSLVDPCIGTWPILFLTQPTKPEAKAEVTENGLEANLDPVHVRLKYKYVWSGCEYHGMLVRPWIFTFTLTKWMECTADCITRTTLGKITFDDRVDVA